MLKPESTEQYIAAFRGEHAAYLNEMRALLRGIAPHAQEVISYGMPALRHHGILVFYAAWKNHLGFYPSGSGIIQFSEELKDFSCSKGAIQFPYVRPLPMDLIEKIVRMRLTENELKAALRKKR